MKREAKTENKIAESGEGSLWEVLAFGLIFVMIFTLLARTAHAAESRDPVSSVEEAEPSTLTPIRMQTAPSAIPSAALPAANMAAGVADKVSSKRYVWASKMTIDTSRSLNPDADVSYSGEYLMQTGVVDQALNLNATFKFGYDREYSFERVDGTDGDFTDPGFALTKTWSEGSEFRSKLIDAVVLGLSGSGGVSREAARRTFVLGFGPSVGVTKRIHKLSLGERFGYQRKFYRYDIRDDGTINAPDVLSSTTDLSYNLTENLALSSETILYYAINFQGTGETTQWTSVSFDWQISKLIATSAGVALKRGTISDDGASNAVKFFDAANSQGFVDLVLNF